MCGGQWPQVRKAKLPGWEHGALCQLCKSETGTLSHRDHCAVTRPANGWSFFPGAVTRFLEGIGEARRTALLTRGVLVVAIPLQPVRQHPLLRWRGDDQPDVTDAALRWYTDGSVMLPRWRSLATAACAIVVVNAAGMLVADPVEGDVLLGG